MHRLPSHHRRDGGLRRQRCRRDHIVQVRRRRHRRDEFVVQGEGNRQIVVKMTGPGRGAGWWVEC